VKPLSDMTRLELAAHIGAEFKRRNINVVLTACGIGTKVK